MPFESEADAAQQLYESVLEDGQARSDEQEMHDRVAEIKQGQTQQTEEPGAEQGATEEDTFTSIDPSTLPPEALPFYKSLQGDYTRKTQALAEERKAYEQLEQYGGVDTALEAIQFATSLATDPNYAMQVHQQLTEALVQAGLTPAEASQAATEQVRAVQEQAPQSDDFAFGDDEYGNPAVKKLEEELAAIRQQYESLSQWRQKQEEDAFNIQLANDMARQENVILTSHPEYDEADLEKIYTISYAYGGNLEQANQVYEQLRNDVIADYIAKKGQVPSGATGQGSTGVLTADEPVKFDGLFDKNLTRLVNERLAQELAAE